MTRFYDKVIMITGTAKKKGIGTAPSLDESLNDERLSESRVRQPLMHGGLMRGRWK